MKILRCMSKLGNERFNRRAFARRFNASPSTIYDRLKRLVSKGCVERVSAGIYTITKKGFMVLNLKNGGRKAVRGSVGKRKNLSQHSNRFIADIVDSSKFDVNKLGGVVSRIKMKNWSYYLVKFGDDSVAINPRKVVVNINEVIGENVEETNFKCVSCAIEYFDRLSCAGLICEGVRLSSEHYARVKSALADVLFVRFNKYFVRLSSGRDFWIDQSKEKEDETNSEDFRERLDGYLKSMEVSKFKPEDGDTLLEIMRLIVVREAKRCLNESE